MARSWRVVGAFHNVGEVVVIVQAPNWQGGLRKGALAIKGLPKLKGRRITVASFSIQEVETVPVVADPVQMQLTPTVECTCPERLTLGIYVHRLECPVNLRANTSEPQPIQEEPGSTD